MRTIGVMHPTDRAPVPPDTVTVFLMTGGSSAQAQDWLSSGSTATANAAAAGVEIIRLSGMTTAGGTYLFSANLFSTGAAVPSSGTSIASSGVNHLVGPYQQYFQIPGGSTGFSFAAFTSGYVMMEQWNK